MSPSQTLKFIGVHLEDYLAQGNPQTKGKVTENWQERRGKPTVSVLVLVALDFLETLRLE